MIGLFTCELERYNITAFIAIMEQTDRFAQSDQETLGKSVRKWFLSDEHGGKSNEFFPEK